MPGTMWLLYYFVEQLVSSGHEFELWNSFPDCTFFHCAEIVFFLSCMLEKLLEVGWYSYLMAK